MLRKARQREVVKKTPLAPTRSARENVGSLLDGISSSSEEEDHEDQQEHEVLLDRRLDRSASPPQGASPPQRRTAAVAPADHAGMRHLEHRLRSEKELRGRAECRLEEARREVEQLSSQLATAKRRKAAAGGGAKRSGAAAAGAGGQLMIAEATAAKLREEASAMQERLREAEQSVGKQQRARRVVDAKVARLADDKATLERELERLGAEMEALRRTRAQPPAPSPEAELSAAVRRERAAAVCGRRVEAARRASLRTTLTAWVQFAQTASWIKTKATSMATRAADDLAEAEARHERAIAALTTELTESVRQGTESTSALQVALAEIEQLQLRLEEQTASAHRSEALAAELGAEVGRLRPLADTAEQAQRRIDAAEKQAAAAEAALATAHSRAAAWESDREESRQAVFKLAASEEEVSRLRARLGARSSSAATAHAAATEQIAAHAARAADAEGLLAKEKEVGRERLVALQARADAAERQLQAEREARAHLETADDKGEEDGEDPAAALEWLRAENSQLRAEIQTQATEAAAAAASAQTEALAAAQARDSDARARALQVARIVAVRRLQRVWRKWATWVLTKAEKRDREQRMLEAALRTMEAAKLYSHFFRWSLLRFDVPDGGEEEEAAEISMSTDDSMAFASPQSFELSP